MSPTLSALDIYVPQCSGVLSVIIQTRGVLSLFQLKHMRVDSSEIRASVYCSGRNSEGGFFIGISREVCWWRVFGCILVKFCLFS